MQDATVQILIAAVNAQKNKKTKNTSDPCYLVVFWEPEHHHACTRDTDEFNQTGGKLQDLFQKLAVPTDVAEIQYVVDSVQKLVRSRV